MIKNRNNFRPAIIFLIPTATRHDILHDSDIKKWAYRMKNVEAVITFRRTYYLWSLVKF